MQIFHYFSLIQLLLTVIIYLILTTSRKMRAQSPTSKFIPTSAITTTRLVSSPHSNIRDQRADSSVNSRVTKITTYSTRPKTTITTTTTYRPVIETRTVRLCTDKRC